MKEEESEKLLEEKKKLKKQLLKELKNIEKEKVELFELEQQLDIPMKDRFHNSNVVKLMVKKIKKELKNA